MNSPFLIYTARAASEGPVQTSAPSLAQFAQRLRQLGRVGPQRCGSRDLDLLRYGNTAAAAPCENAALSPILEKVGMRGNAFRQVCVCLPKSLERQAATRRTNQDIKGSPGCPAC